MTPTANEPGPCPKCGSNSYTSGQPWWNSKYDWTAEATVTCDCCEHDWDVTLSLRAEALKPSSDDPDMPDLRLCSFDYLAEELRRRGATVTPAPHLGDFCNG